MAKSKLLWRMFFAVLMIMPLQSGTGGGSLGIDGAEATVSPGKGTGPRQVTTPPVQLSALEIERGRAPVSVWQTSRGASSKYLSQIVGDCVCDSDRYAGTLVCLQNRIFDPSFSHALR